MQRGGKGEPSDTMSSPRDRRRLSGLRHAAGPPTWSSMIQPVQAGMWAGKGWIAAAMPLEEAHRGAVLNHLHFSLFQKHSFLVPFVLQSMSCPKDSEAPSFSRESLALAAVRVSGSESGIKRAYFDGLHVR